MDWQHSTHRKCFPGEMRAGARDLSSRGGAGRGCSHLLKRTLAAAHRLRLAQPACPKAPLPAPSIPAASGRVMARV